MSEHAPWIAPEELAQRAGGRSAPRITDVRRRPAFEASGWAIAAARWRNHQAVQRWAEELRPAEEVVVHCVHGHQVNQSAAALLTANGIRARCLRGGIDRSGSVATISGARTAGDLRRFARCPRQRCCARHRRHGYL